jgi:hypothetical protein
MMGKLQGARGLPGTGVPSAGFVSVTANTHYKWMFDAVDGDELAFGFARSSPLTPPPPPPLLPLLQPGNLTPFATIPRSDHPLP